MNLYAIYDGHNGPDCSRYLAKKFMSYFISDIANYIKTGKITIEGIKNTIKESFKIFDKQITDNNINHGSCVLFVIVFGECEYQALSNKIYVINLGDSRALLIKNKDEYKQLSIDCTVPNDMLRIHNQINKVFNDQKYQYVKNEYCEKIIFGLRPNIAKENDILKKFSPDQESQKINPQECILRPINEHWIIDHHVISEDILKPQIIIQERILGKIAVSRAFGDNNLSYPCGKNNSIYAKWFMSNIPDIQIYNIENNTYLFLGSDGCFDINNKNYQANQIISEIISNNQNITYKLEELKKYFLKQGDDVTIFIIKL
jgi:serine/threonine protein phosphatase PrpC